MATFPEKTIYSFSLESANAYYTCPESIEELQEIIDYARNNGFKICPAGGLQSFSKVCLISKQIALDLTSFNRILFFDPDARQIIVEGGIKVLDVLSKTLPYGLILKSLTGSTNNTIAGNVSSDVNGKDSWKNGNFGANILSMKVLLSDGRLVVTSPSQKSDLFYSVIGGLGSIGIVVEATLGLQRVPSTTLLARSQKVRHISELLDVMDQLDPNQDEYAYCWTNPDVSDSGLGSGICEKAHFIPGEKIENDPLRIKAKDRIFGLPIPIFWRTFGQLMDGSALKIANLLKYHFSPAHKTQKLRFQSFQYPMVKLFPQWNLKYAPHGFREWQILFDKDVFHDAYIEILTLSKKRGLKPKLCGVRKHCPQSAYLSFAGDGYSMTLNYGRRDIAEQKIKEFENELIKLILSFEGKVYLSKYPYIHPEDLRKMYPSFNHFQACKRAYDKESLFYSDATANWGM